MTTLLRSAAFNLLFFAGTAAMCILCAPLLAVLPRKRLAVLGRVWARMALGLARAVAGISWEVRGAPPKGAAIVASKHQSAWDTIVFFLLLDDPAYVLKEELTAIPVIGWYLRRTGMIAIDRKGGAGALRRMVAKARAAADAGRAIVIFPEGTRTAPGARAPYHPGAAALYGKLALPVVPVALNSGLFWPRRGFVKRPGRIVVEYLPAIPPGLDRTAFTAALEQAIETASARLLTGRPECPPASTRSA